MGAIMCTWILAVTFLCGMSQAYFSNMRSSGSYPCAPRYDSCRESIEDLRALLEITQCLKPDTTVSCPACTSTLSEELIVKLVNALIYTATQNCGFNGKGCGGVPTSSNNGGNTGGLIGGGNIVVGDGTGIVNGGGNNAGNSGVIGGGENKGGSSIIGNGGGGSNGGGGGNPNPGGKTGGTGSDGQNSKDPGLINLGVLSDNDLLNLGIENTKILRTKLGQNNDGAGSTHDSQGLIGGVTGLLGDVTKGLVGGDNKGPLSGVTDGPLSGVTNGPLSGVTNGPLSGVTNGLPSGVTNGPLGGVTNGLLPQGTSSPVNNGDVTTTTATSQGAGVSPKNTGNVGGLTNTVVDQGSSVPSTGSSTVPGTGTSSPPITNVDSGNVENKKDSVNVLNVLNHPTSS